MFTLKIKGAKKSTNRRPNTANGYGNVTQHTALCSLLHKGIFKRTMGTSPTPTYFKKLIKK